MTDAPEWPREIWMAERDEHDQGVVSAVLSEHATVARFDGDKERDREFHRYVDADIYESACQYYDHQVGTLRERAEAAEQRERDARADIERLRGTRVKPLEWWEPRERNNWTHGARTIVGTYYVHADGGRHNAWMVFREPENGEIEQWEGPDRGSLIEAQADAQDDYERRIMSALRTGGTP